jgi:hypothetical protein
MRHYVVQVVPLVLFIMVTLALVLPVQHVDAQELGSDLSATVRAVLLSDPRSSEMSEVELEAMISALTAQAAEQGMTASDIIWQPLPLETFEQSSGEPILAQSNVPLLTIVSALVALMVIAFGIIIMYWWHRGRLPVQSNV